MSMVAIMDAEEQPIIWLPEAYVDKGTQLVYWVRRGIHGTSAQRREITRDHPLLFALIYFEHALQSPETDWEISLNQMHLDMAEEAKQWRYKWGPTEYRVAWVGPREVGKTTWVRILIIWAMAHNWRRSVVLFSNAGKRARQQLKNIKRELVSNRRLRADYPELCTPGPQEVDNAVEYISDGGHAIAASGFEESVLGYQTLNLRPQLMICDDIEPTGSQYSKNEKDKRLATLMEAVFPMNINACVILIGTVTRFGAIMHEIVRAASGGIKAAWITEQKIDCRYYPGVVTNTKTGKEESLWANRWSNAYVHEHRTTDLFLLAMMNQPVSRNKGFWTPDDYRYEFPWLIDTQVLSIDPAMKSQEVNDPTGISIIGFDAPKLNAVVQFAEAVWLDPDGMRKLIEHLLLNNRRITHVIIETNQGGDYVLRQLTPVIPRHIKIEAPHEKDPKPVRVKELHDWYQLGWVWHVAGLHALEEQEKSYPDVDHDDIVDSVAKGARHHLQYRPLPVPR